MQHSPVTASYLTWKPVISAEEVFQATVNFSFLHGDETGRLFWVELRPEEKGRCVIMMRNPDGAIKELLPAPFSARSRVMEYGGMPYVATGTRVIFANFADQRLYSFDSARNETPTAITPEKAADGRMIKFMQPTVSPDGRWLVAACELEGGDKEPENAICLLDLRQNDIQEPVILVREADFYKQPIFSPDGRSLAWLQWNHPHMPWDSTILCCAPFADGQIIQNAICRVAGSESEAVNDFSFSREGKIRLSIDRKGASEDSVDNFFNIYTWHDGSISRTTESMHEIAWILHMKDRILALTFREGIPGLAWVNAGNGSLTELPTPFLSVSKPVACGENLALTGTSSDKPSQLALIKQDGSIEILRNSSECDIPADSISKPEKISFPVSDGRLCHGYFYPPQNSFYQAPDGELPPARVLVHGGPTSMARPGFSREHVFWTSQGYAIFDVNYRGSTGFGRAYRDALLGEWGVLEISDVRDGLNYLRQKRMIGDQVVVSGGSAGGYTVQRLLTMFPEMFAAGASYFGIGNLITLQNLTHKFESRYLEGLLGGQMITHRHVFEDRSPINHLANLKSPMIIFQGSEDKVVPPENSREMAKILASKHIMHEYYEYPDEGHGFRQKGNLVDSLEKEAVFFRKILAGT